MGGSGSNELGMSSHLSEYAKKKTGGTLSPISENESEKNKLKSPQSIENNTTPNTISTVNNNKPLPPNSNITNNSNVDLGVGWETFSTENRNIRNGFLEYVQSHPLGSNLTRKSRRCSINNKMNRSIKDRPKTASFITFSYPSYIPRNIVVPAPADMVTLEVCFIIILNLLY